MKKSIFVLMFFVLILSACGSKSLSEGDKKACEIYQSTVESASNDEISDDEMLDELERSWSNAESDHMQDLLDDLLIYFEEGEGELQDNVNELNSYCSTD